MKLQTKLTLLVLASSCLLLPNLSSSQCTNATGGTITYTDSLGLNPRSSPSYSKGYTVHTFLSSDTFKVTTGCSNVEYLVVAGGGAGGATSSTNDWYVGGGGGGAGAMLTGSLSVSTQTYNITVGTGGTAAAVPNVVSGGNSSFSTVTAIGGGGGGCAATNVSGGNGGSGGGGSAGANGGTGTTGGNNGGNSNIPYSGYTPGGAGGGAGGVGSVDATTGAAGGVGLANSISGTAVTYATGGTGGGASNSSPDGAANTGNGGGGASYNSTVHNGGNGGSGIVIIRYKTPGANTNGIYDYSQLMQTNSNGVDIISIFPNPAHDKFEYEIGSTEKMTLQVRVVNMLGQIVINETENIDKGISNHNLNVSTLSSGTYLLQVTTENKGLSAKQFQIK